MSRPGDRSDDRPVDPAADAHAEPGRFDMETDPRETPVSERSAATSLSLLGAVCIGLVRMYQWTLGPFLGGRCRFRPTCSHYMMEAVRKYGAVRGVPKGLFRILRCHPWGATGHDPP